MVAGAVAPPRLDLANEDLVRAHVHAIWLAETGRTWTAHGRPARRGRRRPDARAARPRSASSSPIQRQRQRAAPARTAPCSASIARDLARRPWWHDRLDRGHRRRRRRSGSTRPADRWRDLYRAALAELDAADTPLGDTRSSATATAKRGARPRPEAARASSDLLRNEDRDDVQTDFYSYRYFASEGFLPGYSFPRLPLAAYIPGLTGAPRGGDYLQRPRFLAISEFGPGALIYHEGARYEVDRVSSRRADARPGRTAPPSSARAAATAATCTTTGGRRRRLRATAAQPLRDTLPGPDAADSGVHPPPRPDLLRRGGTPPRRLRDRHLLPVRPARRARRADSTPPCTGDDGSWSPPDLRRHRDDPARPTSACAAASNRDSTATGSTSTTGRWLSGSRAGRRDAEDDGLDDAAHVAPAAGHPLRRGPPQRPGHPARRAGRPTRPRSRPRVRAQARHRGRLPAGRHRAGQRAAARPGGTRPDCCSSRPPRAAPACCGGWSPTGRAAPGRPEALEILHFDPDTGADLQPRRQAPRALRAGLLRLPAVLRQPAGPPAPRPAPGPRPAAADSRGRPSAARRRPGEHDLRRHLGRSREPSSGLERDFLDLLAATATGCPTTPRNSSTDALRPSRLRLPTPDGTSRSSSTARTTIDPTSARA